MRLVFQCSNYLAEILQGGSIAEHFWYYVVRRKASNEVIDLIKFETFEEATEAARELISKMDQAGTLSFLLPNCFRQCSDSGSRNIDGCVVSLLVANKTVKAIAD